MVMNSYKANGNRATGINGHSVVRHAYHPPPINGSSLRWLDIRVFYVRVFKCQLRKTTPEVLTLNCVPLHPDTLLEVNGVRANMRSDGVPTLLKRDRVDRKSEEVTFVSTNSTKMSGSVKFEVFDKDILLLSGVLELGANNGFVSESSHDNGQRWSMKCESDIVPGTSFFKGKKNSKLPCSALPTIEVYIAGSFLSTPIILTRTLSSWKKNAWMGTLSAIQEHEASEKGEDATSELALQAPDNMIDRLEDEENNRLYERTAYLDGEDGELSWFNAGVRVGVGIGLSVCLGVGIGVGVLVKTYQGTAGNFRRRRL